MYLHKKSGYCINTDIVFRVIILFIRRLLWQQNVNIAVQQVMEVDACIVRLKSMNISMMKNTVFIAVHLLTDPAVCIVQQKNIIMVRVLINVVGAVAVLLGRDVCTALQKDMKDNTSLFLCKKMLRYCGVYDLLEKITTLDSCAQIHITEQYSTLRRFL